TPEWSSVATALVGYGRSRSRPLFSRALRHPCVPASSSSRCLDYSGPRRHHRRGCRVFWRLVRTCNQAGGRSFSVFTLLVLADYGARTTSLKRFTGCFRCDHVFTAWYAGLGGCCTCDLRRHASLSAIRLHPACTCMWQ